MTIKEYEVEFIDLKEYENPFEPMLRRVRGRTNNDARTAFKREMKAEFDAIEGTDYKIDHITVHIPLRERTKISEGYFNKLEEEKDYGRYEIGYKAGPNVFFTGQIITASTQKEAIDKYMNTDANAIRKNVRANRI